MSTQCDGLNLTSEMGGRRGVLGILVLGMNSQTLCFSCSHFLVAGVNQPNSFPDGAVERPSKVIIKSQVSLDD